jgi:ribosomal 50S subunit-recycling heat shock protein
MMEAADKLRVDKWLWAARFFKTRGLALDAIKGGKIELNGHKPKPSKTLSVGDKLKITQPHRQVEVSLTMRCLTSANRLSIWHWPVTEKKAPDGRPKGIAVKLTSCSFDFKISPH